MFLDEELMMMAKVRFQYYEEEVFIITRFTRRFWSTITREALEAEGLEFLEAGVKMIFQIHILEIDGSS